MGTWDLEVLQWVWENECPFNHKVCLSAKKGHLFVLKCHYHNQPCNSDEWCFEKRPVVHSEVVLESEHIIKWEHIFVS